MGASMVRRSNWHAPTAVARAFLVAVAVSVAVAASIPSPADPWSVLAAVAIPAAMIAALDSGSGRVPDLTVLGCGVPVLVLVARSIAENAPGAGPGVVSGVGVAVLVMGGPLLVAHLADPRVLGFGDVKLGAVLAAATGVVAPYLGLLALCTACAWSLGYAAVRGRSAIPFAPGLVVGTFVALALADVLGADRWGWR
jgi:leader peptidase (prepilin peptidase)/N-methyltransferase